MLRLPQTNFFSLGFTNLDQVAGQFQPVVPLLPQEEERRRVHLVGACYGIEEGLVQRRGDTKHAAGFRRSVVESVQGVWRQNHG
jgi:hypothetical protein